MVLPRSFLAAAAVAALLLHEPAGAQSRDDESLASVVEILTREWFEGQLGDLPRDELPEEEVLEADIADMRDGVLRRVAGVLSASDAMTNGRPDDAANSAAMVRLVEAFAGLERTTPIFTKLALSKVNDPEYRSGWRLCAIRVIAETYLPQAQESHAQEERGQ